MAPRNRSNSAEKPAQPEQNVTVSPLTKTDTPMDYKAALKPSNVGLAKVTRGRGESTNPCKGFVELGTPLMLDVPNSVEARKVSGYLRRDALDRNLGVRIQYRNASGDQVFTTRTRNSEGKEVTVYPDGITEVHFEGKEKSKRSYTAKDIAAWAADNGFGEITGPIPASVRDAFKAARESTTSDETSA